MKMGWVVTTVVSKTMLFKYIKNMGVITLFVGVITQLAARCRNVNMGFQKLEPISFDLMYVDKWYTFE